MIHRLMLWGFPGLCQVTRVNSVVFMLADFGMGRNFPCFSRPIKCLKQKNQPVDKETLTIQAVHIKLLAQFRRALAKRMP